MNKLRSDYEVIAESSFSILIKDLDLLGRASVTNDADNVILDLDKKSPIGNRLVYYIDSMGKIDQLLIENGRFKGFKACSGTLRKILELQCS